MVGESALRGPRYTRLVHGAYLTGDDVTHETRIQGFRLRAGDSAVLVGPSAAWAWGVRMAGSADPIHVEVATGAVPGRFVVPHRGVLPCDDVTTTRLGPTTTPIRTAIDLARGVGTRHLSDDMRVAWVEALLQLTGLSAATLVSDAERRCRLHGLPKARTIVASARDGVESVRETLLRLLIVRAGFPEPQVQLPVRAPNGSTLARLDLGWEAHRVGAEYDGADHLEQGRWSRDLQRHNLLRSVGWTVLQVDKAGLARPGRFLSDLERLVPRSAPSAVSAPSPVAPTLRR
jgi:hypothetical protein